MKIIFEKFYDDDIEDLEEAQDAVSFYEWTIADNDIKGRVVQKWTRVYNMASTNKTHVRLLCSK